MILDPYPTDPDPDAQPDPGLVDLREFTPGEGINTDPDPERPAGTTDRQRLALLVGVGLVVLVALTRQGGQR